MKLPDLPERLRSYRAEKQNCPPHWRPSRLDIQEQHLLNEALAAGLEFKNDQEWKEYLESHGAKPRF